MSLFRTILVAADFSEISREAFRLACSLAQSDETRVTVLHAEAPPIVYGELDFPIVLPEADPSQHDAIDKRLRDLYAPDRPLRVEYRTREGFAVEEILRSGEELGADLIVVGTHGLTGLRRLLLGSVAEAVLRRARCPVLALRSPAHLAPGSSGEKPDAVTPSPSTLLKGRVPDRLSPWTILCPTDFSERSMMAFQVACSLAREHGARLIVLHAALMVTVYGGTFPGVPLDPAIYQHALEERLRQIQIRGPSPIAEAVGPEGAPDLGTPHPEIQVQHRLWVGDAATEILQVADELKVDLIVMGTHGRTGLGRMLMGSVAESVLRQACCPVLMVKSPLSETEPPAAERAAPKAGSTSRGPHPSNTRNDR